MTYSWLHFWASSIRAGHIPLWDPYAFGGRPFAGETLPSAYYPLHFIFALVPFNRNGVVSPMLFHEWLAFNHMLCAVFMFALLRQLERSRFAAFTGGCIFALSGMMVSMLWPPYIESAIWVPAIFLFFLRAMHATTTLRAFREAAFAGICLAMPILIGGIPFTMMQAVLLITAAIYFVVTAKIPWQRAATILGFIFAIAIGIGAVQLLPSWEYGQRTLRFIDGGAFPASEKIPYDRLVHGMWPQSIVTGLLPTAFGGKIGGEENWIFYIGAFPFALAVLAIWRCRNNLWVRYLTGLAAVAFAYSLGEFSPLHGILYAVVPMAWVSRSASRIVYLISFALTILAAFGMDTLLESANRELWLPARPFLKWIALCCAAIFFLPAFLTQLDLTIWTAFSLLLILLTCWIVSWMMKNSPTPGMRALLAALILFDLSAFNWRESSVAALEKAGDQYEQMLSLRGASLFVKSQPGIQRARVLVAPEPNIGDVYGVQTMWGGGSAVLTDQSGLGQRDDLFNIRYYIRQAVVTDPGQIYEDAKWKVYENPKAFPRAWIVHEAVVEPSHVAVFQRLRKPIDLRKIVLLENPLKQNIAGDGANETIDIKSYEANAMALTVHAATPGILVLSESDYPGWRATVNGTDTPIYKADGALRGIVIPAGNSQVELRYAPMTIYAGGIISLLTLAGVCGFLVIKR